MTDSSCDRWMTLADQAAIGVSLSESEQSWLAEHAASCPECASESRFWSSLGAVMTKPDVLEKPVERSSKPASGGKHLVGRLQGRHGWVFGLAAGIALTLSAAWLLREHPKTSAGVANMPVSRLVSVAGDVQIGARAARAGELLSPTQSVRTQLGFACVALDNSITACLDAHSEAELSLEDPAQLSIRLKSGRLMSRLDRQPNNRTFRVETQRADVVARGTVFSVTLDAEHAVTVRLHEGRVWLRTQSNQSGDLVAPAQAYVKQGIEPRGWPDAAVAEDRVLLALSKLPRAGQRTRLDVTTRPNGANVTVDDVVLGPTPVSAFLGQGNRLSVAMDGYAPVTELLPKEGSDTIERNFELAPTEAAADAQEVDGKVGALAAPASPGALLARAQALRSQGKYRECAATYRQLVASFPHSDEARVSLVSLGELELSELGQPSQALRSFEAYLRSGGPLTREARYGKIRALQLLGRDAEQKSAIADFVRDYPNSVQAASLRSRLQTRQP